MKISSFDAIIFDHDGTLVDTETPDFEACKLLCQEIGALLTMEYWAEKIVGRMDGYDALFEEIVKSHHNGYTKAVMWERLRELWAITLENVSIMPGVTKLLPQLQASGYAMGVATASDHKWASRWLTRFELLPYFQVIATRDDVVHNKPAPDVYLFVADQLSIPPERCLVFEDSVAGTRAAKAAGMTVIAVPSHVTRVLDFSEADLVVDSLELVTDVWMKELEKRLRQF